MRLSLKERVGEIVFAGLTLALGVYALIGAFGIRVPESVRVGPTVFPILVAIILMVSAAIVLIGLLRGRTGTAEEGEDVDLSANTDWVTVAKLAGFLVAHMVLVDLIGWAFAAALLFGGAAWSLGAKRWWVALLVGLAVGVVIQVVFGVLLGLSLPLGPLLGWIPAVF